MRRFALTLNLNYVKLLENFYSVRRIISSALRLRCNLKKRQNLLQRKYIIQSLTVIISTLITVALAVFITLYVKEKQKPKDVRAEYEVTFNSNGGKFQSGGTLYSISAFEDSVIYAPRIPNREGYVLDGWSTDRHGAHIWYFDSETVTKNVTLYAVWHEAVNIVFDANGGTLSGGEEKVSLVIGRGNAPSVQDPVLAGFRFDGWYSGDELWDGVASEDITLKAKWSYIDSASLDMPQVKGGVAGFYWQPVNKAESYTVRLHKNNDLVLEEVVEKAEYKMPEDMAAGEYNVTVIANGDGEKTTSSYPAEIIYRYKCLEKFDVYYDTLTNTVKWQKVENAEWYAVYVNGTQVKEDITDTSFDLTGCQAGSKVHIAARGEGYYPSQSANDVYVKKLRTPDKITVLTTALNTIRIIWTPSDNADTYILDFGDGVEEATGVGFDLAPDSGHIKNGEFSFTIQAKDSSGVFLKSDKSEKYVVSLGDTSPASFGG